MITAYDLLITAPEGQVKRCQIICKAIADSRWGDAAYSLRNAAAETDDKWSQSANDLAEFCEAQHVDG
jgi:hypothetical protein